MKANLPELPDVIRIAARIGMPEVYLQRLTFFDDDVTAFFSPHAAGKSVMFLIALGQPARRGA
ncbi:MAG: hypothetical protein C4289_09090 [Chloroflexota bacterium]